jgi:hypothetical protein
LLKDSSPQVRFRAAQALVKRGDTQAVPVLIALLGEGPPLVAWGAEEFLHRLAGKSAPPVALQITPASRRQCATAWDAWWRNNRDALRLEYHKLQERLSPLLLFTDLDEGLVVALGPDWQECWHISGLEGPVDVQLLPSGRVLVAENHGQRVTERDRAGRVVWEYRTKSYPGACWRRPDGNTVIATRHELVEVIPAGQAVWSRRWAEALCGARPLRDGRIAVLTAQKHLVTLTGTGREVSQVELDKLLNEWASLRVLPNGHYLVAPSNNAWDVGEFDAAGRRVWEQGKYRPAGADRLPNGHLVLSEPPRYRLVELDRDGKVIRERKTEGRPWHVQYVP